MTLQGKTLGVISLGCDKNRVDTERMLGIMTAAGCVLTDDPSEAQILVVNTCAFLESARAEAIDEIFDCASYRDGGNLEKLVVTGCLPQKFIDELFEELPEVDVFLGFLDYDELPNAVLQSYEGKRVNAVGLRDAVSEGERVVTTPLHYAYLKIADGCDNHCTYCLIPAIRGKYVSHPIKRLVKEAQSLGDLSELILVAQDVTRYGRDLYGKNCLCDLIRALSDLDNIGAIRLLYCYPDQIDENFIAELKNNPKLMKYLDIPLQHAHPAVLKRMNRKGTGEQYLQLIRTLREEVPNISIRSTFICGFPGETEEQSLALNKFLETAQLDYAGFFAYSKEEGTAAARLDGHMDDEEKDRRVQRAYQTQTAITDAKLRALIGQTIEVVMDGIDYDLDAFYGHADFQTPGLDGRVYFTTDEIAMQGERYRVRIGRVENLDLYGEVL